MVINCDWRHTLDKLIKNRLVRWFYDDQQWIYCNFWELFQLFLPLGNKVANFHSWESTTNKKIKQRRDKNKIISTKNNSRTIVCLISMIIIYFRWCCRGKYLSMVWYNHVYLACVIQRDLTTYLLACHVNYSLGKKIPFSLIAPTIQFTSVCCQQVVFVAAISHESVNW